MFKIDIQASKIVLMLHRLLQGKLMKKGICLPREGSHMCGNVGACLQFEGKNVFCALVLLTPCPRGKPLHRLSLPLN